MPATNGKLSDEREELSIISKRLDALISLSLRPLAVDATIYEQAVRLRALRFTNSEIAAILGKTPIHISKELSIGKKVQNHGRK